MILTIGVIICVIGFTLCVIADCKQNKGRRFAIEENWEGVSEKTSVLPKKIKRQVFLLNLIGYILMLVAFLLLLYYGYFDKYIAMLFG